MSDSESDNTTTMTSLRWSWWDFAGICLHTTGTMLNELDNGLRMMAAHCGGAANHSRMKRDERDAEASEERERQIMARALDSDTLDWTPEDLT